MLVISLSSIPPRFDRIGATLRSLLAQTARARILLYIPKTYARFPEWGGALPEVPEGIEIRRCEVDHGPATKVLSAAAEFRGQDADILYCDDDRAYAPGWAQGLLTEKAAHRGCCICYMGIEAQSVAPGTGVRHDRPRAVRRWRKTDIGFHARALWHDLTARARQPDAPPPTRAIWKRSGFVDIAEGCGGVLVRPEFFDDPTYDIPPNLWGVDDIWLSGSMARQGIPIWLRAGLREPDETDAQRFAPLLKAVVNGVDRRAANAQGVEYFRSTHKIWI